VDAIGGFDPAIFTNEEYEMWIRASLAGFAFTRYTRPLGWYAHRPDSLSASETRMLRGILRVLAKTRPTLAPDSPELAILEHQVVRFRAELAAAERKERLQRYAAGRALLHVRQVIRRAVFGAADSADEGRAMDHRVAKVAPAIKKSLA
jgi:hypothetical protein